MSLDALGPEQSVAAQRCATCPKMCRAACPTLEATANERHQPWGHAAATVDAARSPLGFASAGLVDSTYTCATCSACTVDCKVDGVETPELTWAVRAAVHDAGATPEVGLRAVAEARRGRVLVNEEPPAWDEPWDALAAMRALSTPGADLLLLAGCGTLGRRPVAALAAARLLHALEVPFQVPERHVCCGMPALTFGDRSSLARMLDAAGASVAAVGARRVAVQSPSCAWMLGVRAGVEGRPLGAVVEPLAALLARALAGRGVPEEKPATAVTYHDPCFLARHQEVLEAPRQALAGAGLRVEELPRNGRRTRCSGRGGGLALTHPEVAAGYLRLLAADAAGAGDALVTGCASCATALEQALPGRTVQDLSEALAAVLAP